MKKIVLLIITVFVFLSFLNTKEEEVLIPNEAIRLRVIASSNTVEDQNIKIQVRNKIQSEIIKLSDKKDIDKTRKNIKADLKNIEEITKETLKELNADSKYDINYGYNYFPEKQYKGVKYEEGYYESLVITLGEGKGENFWCVLFPPLCLLEDDEAKTKDVEYKFYIQELIDKYF